MVGEAGARQVQPGQRRRPPRRRARASAPRAPACGPRPRETATRSRRRQRDERRPAGGGARHRRRHAVRGRVRDDRRLAAHVVLRLALVDAQEQRPGVGLDAQVGVDGPDGDRLVGAVAGDRRTPRRMPRTSSALSVRNCAIERATPAARLPTAAPGNARNSASSAASTASSRRRQSGSVRSSPAAISSRCRSSSFEIAATEKPTPLSLQALVVDRIEHLRAHLDGGAGQAVVRLARARPAARSSSASSARRSSACR